MNTTNAIRSFALTAAIMTLSGSLAISAEKVRFYPFGEADDGAAIGEFALETEDIWEPPSEDADGAPVFDSIGDFVLLTAFDGDSAPVYVAGRTDGLALDFDGVDDLLQSEAFDPRNFNTFSALSQGWVRADEDGAGVDQSIWSLGTDNGGLGITADGFWNLRAVNGAPEKASEVAVEFGEWTHVAVFRGGNSARMYVNGELAVSSDGVWFGTGPVTVGNSDDGATPFDGSIDDFNIAGFSDFVFDPATDIDFSLGPDPTGVAGDVDQDGDADMDDYFIWSANVGFDNGLGFGDISTLLQGDVDGNGMINYFDFQAISDAAAAAGAPLEVVPEPAGAVLALVGFGVLAFFRRRAR